MERRASEFPIQSGSATTPYSCHDAVQESVPAGSSFSKADASKTTVEPALDLGVTQGLDSVSRSVDRDIELMMASLRADEQDITTYFQVLAIKLASGLGNRVTVERIRSRLGHQGRAQRIAVIISGIELQQSLSPGTSDVLSAARCAAFLCPAKSCRCQTGSADYFARSPSKPSVRRR